MFTLINPKRQSISAAESEQESLLETYKEKEKKARHLEAYADQVVQMEKEFAVLLSQLPKDTMVSELIEGINMVGVGSGIRFQDITVEEEVEQEFFVEQPINIKAIGEYHQFGSFITGIARLPRIITMHDFEVVNQQPSLDRMPQLQLTLRTKTYRSKEVVEEATSEKTDATTEGGN